MLAICSLTVGRRAQGLRVQRQLQVPVQGLRGSNGCSSCRCRQRSLSCMQHCCGLRGDPSSADAGIWSRSCDRKLSIAVWAHLLVAIVPERLFGSVSCLANSGAGTSAICPSSPISRTALALGARFGCRFLADDNGASSQTEPFAGAAASHARGAQYTKLQDHTRVGGCG